MKKDININRISLIKTCGTKIVYFLTSFLMFANLALATGSGNSVGEVVDNINGGEGVYGIIKQIIGILAWVGFAVAIFKLIQIGMMMLMGAGKSRSDAKTALIPWLVGAGVCALFGVVGPWFIDLILGSNSGGVFDI